MNQPGELEGVVAAVDADELEVRNESQEMRPLVGLESEEEAADAGDDGERLQAAQSSEVLRRLGL